METQNGGDDPVKDSDLELLERWGATRDASAFKKLVDRHAPMVYATSCRILRDTHRAEDVTQSCFLKLLQAPEAARTHLGGWLHRVAANLSVSLMRSEVRRRAREARGAVPGECEAKTRWDEVKVWVDGAIDELPDQLRSVLVAHFLEARSHREIARELGVPRSTVTYRIKAGIEAVRRSLRRRGVHAAPAALATCLESLRAEAAPAGIVAVLGKMAVAGHAPTAGTVAATPGPLGPLLVNLLAGGAMKLTISISAAVVLVAILLVVSINESSAPPGPEPETVTPPPSVAEAPRQAPPPSSPATEKDRREDADATPVVVPGGPEVASVAGTVRDPDGKPIADAEVHLSLQPEGDPGDVWGGLLQEDYYRRERWFSTETDEFGEYHFEEVAHDGAACVVASLEGTAGSHKTITLEVGKAIEDADLTLASGKTLRGVVTSTLGLPVTDAVVSVYQAWHSKDMAWSYDVTATDEQGRFRLGLAQSAERCTLRVNSDSLGQDFFHDLAVGEDTLHLQMKETASVRGTVTWNDGQLAVDVVVCVAGRVPDAPVPIDGTARRPELERQAGVDAAGSYEISGLPPGLSYSICVMRDKPEEHRPTSRPLTPRWKNRFTLSPGEVKEWSPVVPFLTVVTGRVVTAQERTPVAGTRVEARKDGKVLDNLSCETGADGSFRFELNSGPGDYRLYAQPVHGMELTGDILNEHFGKSYTFVGGEEVEVDLEIFEPIVLPLRVLAPDGTPVESIQTQLTATSLDGRELRLGTSRSLDEEGRWELLLYFPVAHFSLGVSYFPEGPGVTLGDRTATSGTVLPEETIVLPRTSDLSGRLLDSSGAPIQEEGLRIVATYPDDKRQRFHRDTDREGRFSLERCVRAGAVTLRISAGDRPRPWASGLLDLSNGTPLDLGDLVFDRN